MGAFWNKEQFKFIIKFSEANESLTDYIVSTDERINSNALVSALDFDFSSSQSNTSSLFTLQASENSLTIFDYIGQLNPLNVLSKYYGYMTPGLHVLAYIADYVENVEDYNWRPYGNWFVSSWNGGMENGTVTEVTINCDDIISEISPVSLVDTEYNGIKALDALKAALQAAELTESDYTIDTALDLSFSYTQLQNTVAMTINDILTLSRGYCAVNHNGTLKFMSLTRQEELADTYEVGNTIGALASSIASGINYNKVTVRYPNGSNSQLLRAIHEQSMNITNGDTTAKLDLPSGILSIEAVRTILKGCTEEEKITDIKYIKSGDSISITVSADITVGKQRECLLDVYVATPTSSSYNEYTANIDAIASANSYTYVYEAPYTTTEENAKAIGDELALLLKRMRAQVSCGTCMLSPNINIGDTIVISDVSEEYDGNYALVSYSITIGSTYNTTVKLLKYEEV